MTGESSQQQQRLSGPSSSSALERFDSRIDSVRGSTDAARSSGGGPGQRLMLPSGATPSTSGGASGVGGSGGGDSPMDSLDGQLGADGRRKRGPKKSSSAFPFKKGKLRLRREFVTDCKLLDIEFQVFSFD